jgi:hypothetical protein
MASQQVVSLAPGELIERKIHLVRGEKVMLSNDLAALYDVEPRVLVQAVKRNIGRFPPDFMFQLTRREFENLKSQNVISSWGGARRATPYAFTEQGVAMLSSVLRSERAVQVNIAIMRTFVKLREVMATHKDLEHQIAELERKYEGHDQEIQVIFQTIRELVAPPETPKKRIGFRV